MKSYRLRYDGNENRSYSEKNIGERSYRITKPTDKFGKKLEAIITKLSQEHQDKKFQIEVISW